jgi:hypothetical protein
MRCSWEPYRPNFYAALQGITSESAKIDVSGLVNFDTTVLSGADLKVRESPQVSDLRSLDFHADASRRRWSVTPIAVTELSLGA